jgi:hypothetical protein
MSIQRSFSRCPSKSADGHVNNQSCPCCSSSDQAQIYPQRLFKEKKMFSRVAYFVGEAVNGASEALLAQLHICTLGYATLPKVLSASLEVPIHRDASAPQVFACIRMTFEKAEDIDVALGSAQRDVVRAGVAQNVLPLFEGTVHHIAFRDFSAS